MRKITLILFVFCAFLVIKSNAQISAGVKAGINLSMVTDSTSSGYKGVFYQRFNYGAVFNFNLKENLSIQSELLIQKKEKKKSMVVIIRNLILIILKFLFLQNIPLEKCF